MIFKRFLNFSFILIIISSFWIISENFLVNNNKKISNNQVKQEIMESLAQILKQECKSIELSAVIQQVLCNCIEEIAQGQGDSFFAKSGKRDLISFLNKLKSIKDSNASKLKDLERNLSFLKLEKKV